jgi:hypothetical protein
MLGGKATIAAKVRFSTFTVGVTFYRIGLLGLTSNFLLQVVPSQRMLISSRSNSSPSEIVPMPSTKHAIARAKSASTENRRLRILVSSVVYGYEDFLESIYSILGNFGYEVLMSYTGTIPIDPDISAMSSCLKAVEECDVFLGIILPRYGSGKEEGHPHSIVHREAIKAIELNKPRWFLVHEHVAVARKLLEPYRDESEKARFVMKPGIKFESTVILQDLRVLDLYELAMRHDIPEVKNRKGNWVHTYGTDEDARLFATSQFRRYRELEQKYLSRISDPTSIRRKVGNP